MRPPATLGAGLCEIRRVGPSSPPGPLATELTAEEWAQDGTILMAQPFAASALDLPFGSVEQETSVGHVRALV